MTRSTRKLEGNEKKDETVVISAGKRMLTSKKATWGLATCCSSWIVCCLVAFAGKQKENHKSPASFAKVEKQDPCLSSPSPRVYPSFPPVSSVPLPPSSLPPSLTVAPPPPACPVTPQHLSLCSFFFLFLKHEENSN